MSAYGPGSERDKTEKEAFRNYLDDFFFLSKHEYCVVIIFKCSCL